MKKFLPAFLILIAAESYSQPIKFDKKINLNWKWFNVKEKVKSITEYNYKDFVPRKDNFVTLNIYKFDNLGNCIENALVSKDGAFLERVTSMYDKNGNRIEDKYFKENGAYSRFVYKYDAQGNQVEATTYDPAGKLESTSQVSYDKHGNYTLELYKGARTYKEVHVYEYDAQNRMISSKRDSEKKTLYKYNKDTIETISFGYYGEEHVKEVYNKAGKYIYRQGLGDKTGVSKPFIDTYKYDAAGNLTEIRQNKDGGLLEYPYSERHEYVYDKKGNWIKRTSTTIDGKPMCSIERKIEYF